MMKTKIVIATHKDCAVPENESFLPVFVGSALSTEDLPYQRDDEGENISLKNRSYCELTGMYWAYKNLRSDYIGLCHYRRYFDPTDLCFDQNQILLPKKRHYYIETVYDQFSHAHGQKGLDLAREIIEKDHKEYLCAFDRCMKKRSLHIYNIFVMRYDIFIQYCDFLFDILFKIERELGEQTRLYGHISERLLDVFIEANAYSYEEADLIMTEKTDWPRKIFSFIKRKYSVKRDEI